VETAAEAAAIASAHWELGGAALLVGRAPDESLEVEDLVEEAVRVARNRGIEGQAVTPFVLSFLHDRSGGRTLAVNRELIAANAGLAAEIAVAYADATR
jgi:pseudouridine-5'-phosphate glycosidase